ncbi:SRPBCC family protein [uncultured Jatrophihabitans sp.]|uniref:SRPBCC family protein n=1 Tax=uncultured Jatrophihabitans sp. TaxID=1610747 RepID=UPI0035CABF88
MAHSDTSVSVNRRIEASAKDVFDVLSLPDRHPQLDGTGFVRSADHADRVTANGQTFRMNMTGDHMGGDYQTDNLVTGFVPDKLIAWKTAPAGNEPPGWEWVWELEPQGPNETDVTLTYDWSKVEDKKILALIEKPLVTKHQLEESLSHLAEAVSGS